MSEVDRVVKRCTTYWRRTKVPRRAIDEMRNELDAHLREAIAEGKPVVSVVGHDLTAFAETWAREHRGPFVPPSVWSTIVPALVALLVGIFMFFVSDAIPTTVEYVSEECCPWRVVERVVEPVPGGEFMFWMVSVVAVLALAAAMLLFLRLFTAASVALALGAIAAAFAPPAWIISLVLLLAMLWVQWVLRRAYRAAMPLPP